MNAKKMKAIRKLAKQSGIYDPSKPKQYKVFETKKLQASYDKDGNLKYTPVVKKTVINANKFGLKQLMKSYEAGELVLYSLKDMHAMAKEQAGE